MLRLSLRVKKNVSLIIKCVYYYSGLYINVIKYRIKISKFIIIIIII